MTGCTYERIEPADDGDIPKLMASLKSYDEEKKAFDLGAWTQLERTIRSSGKLEWADDVYRERMWQDRRFRAAWKKRLWLWGYVTGFGTRKWQLAVMCPVVLVIGTLTYFLGGLELDPRVANANNNYTKGLECRCRSGGLERFEVSLEVSTREFFPLSLPLAEECVPEFPLQKWTAMLQRVLGWILIPLLAASFTGILNRKAKTEPESSGDGE